MNKTQFHGYDQLGMTDVNAHMPYVMKLKEEDHAKCVKEHRCPTITPSLAFTPCLDGKAGEYECSNVDMLSFVNVADLGCGGDLNDIWGWTDPTTDREYALVGCADGTSFVDVTDPMSPAVLGFLRTHTSSSLWRDIKVYNNFAFIVSEARNHGMQVFDLTQLRDIKPSDPIFNFEETAHYDEMGNTHNIVGNEDTGFMYAVGTSTCNSGLHMINVRDPLNPQFSGCFGDDGYVHDAQCVVYDGPDNAYTDHEICFCYNEDTLTVVDVSDKTDVKMLSRVPYNLAFYTHQGWLIEDQSHLLLNDELDELQGPDPNTRSMIWNVESLDRPVLIGSFYSKEQSTDHNLYIRDNIAYESNYCAGLRVLDVTGIKSGTMEEIGFFDLAPDCASPGFHGAWSSYPYFKSNTIVVSSIERGLFVLRFTGK